MLMPAAGDSDPSCCKKFGLRARRQEEERRKLLYRNKGTDERTTTNLLTASQSRPSESPIAKASSTATSNPQPTQTPFPLSQPAHTKPTAPLDPIVHLLIHCPLPDTKPLILKIRLSTTFKAVRENWLLQQDPTAFPETIRSEIFLTWRKRRVFDFTTCKSLGIGVGPTGEVVLASNTGRFSVSTTGTGIDGSFEDGWENEEGNAQIHMLAVTQRYLDEEAKRKKMAEEEEKQTARAAITGQVEHARDSRSSERAVGAASIRIILKAKGLEDYKLKVSRYKDDNIQSIERMYRKVRKIPLETTVVLMFEGDRPKDDDEVQATDVADMDVVEVHVRS